METLTSKTVYAPETANAYIEIVREHALANPVGVMIAGLVLFIAAIAIAKRIF